MEHIKCEFCNEIIWNQRHLKSKKGNFAHWDCLEAARDAWNKLVNELKEKDAKTS